MKRSLWLFLVPMALLWVSCQSGKPLGLPGAVVEPVRGHENPVGHFYYLPRTVLAIEVSVMKTHHEPGPLAPYAEKLLGFQDVITRPSTTYSIHSVNLKWHAEPDPDARFSIQLPDGAPPAGFSLHLTETGLITGVNRPVSESGTLRSQPEIHTLHKDRRSDNPFAHFIELNLHERIDTILERVTIDTTVVERQTLRRSYVEKSSEQRAREVADHIIEIRDKKFDLITGFAEIPYSRETLAYMYEELQRKESEYIALFTGTTRTELSRHSFRYIPRLPLADHPQPLFYFSEQRGMVQESETGGRPVSIEIIYETPLRLPGQSQALPRQPGNEKPTGFYYRIPEYGKVIIWKDLQKQAEARIPISQFGNLYALPAQGLQIEYYPKSGNIQSIKYN